MSTTSNCHKHSASSSADKLYTGLLCLRIRTSLDALALDRFHARVDSINGTKSLVLDYT